MFPCLLFLRPHLFPTEPSHRLVPRPTGSRPTLLTDQHGDGALGMPRRWQQDHGPVAYYVMNTLKICCHLAEEISMCSRNIHSRSGCGSDKIALGIRPEHISVGGQGISLGDAHIRVVEPTGSETLLFVDAVGQPMHVLDRTCSTFNAHDVILFFAASEYFHFFRYRDWRAVHRK